MRNPPRDQKSKEDDSIFDDTQRQHKDREQDWRITFEES
jgi:hypothetical protein